MPEPLLYERDGDVAVLTLNRPEALNALSSALLRELVRQFDACDADPSIGAIVLTGQGERAFTAGMDLKEAAEGTDALSGADADPAAALDRCRTPVIAAVNGLCITGGMEIILATDMVLASENARFADTHARVGIQPWWGLTVALPQAIGFRRAREMSATGNFIDAQTALDWGLVNHVVPHDELLPFAHKLAADIVSNNQPAVRRIMATYDEGELLAGNDAWLNEAEVAEAWISGSTADDLEANRQAVMDRGRTQA